MEGGDRWKLARSVFTPTPLYKLRADESTECSEALEARTNKPPEIHFSRRGVVRILPRIGNTTAKG